MTKQPAIRIIALILLFGLVGGLLSCGLAYGVTQKWYVRWKTLPQAAEPFRAIRGASIDTVDVETDSGKILRFDIYEPELGWTAVDAPLNESDEGCERFLRTSPPADVLDQRLVCEDYSDAGVTTMYVMERGGLVSYWSASDSGYEIFLYLIFPAVGIPLGMALGLVIGLVRRWQGQRKQQA